MSERVVAVVVTWNRRTLLEESLGALASQTRPVDAVVVVDNDSDDGTREYLEQEAARGAVPGLDVLRLSANIGGAGGFAAGIERALVHHPDLVWLLDDDTVPTPSAAEHLVRAWRDYPGARRPTVLASKVVWTDGRDHPMNTPRAWVGATRAQRRHAAAVGAVPVRSASFVSVMCDADAVRRAGTPIADYFLWNDDFEYTTRLVRGRDGLYVPDSLVVHKTRTFGSTDADPGARFFYEVRNKTWMFTRSRSLSRPEKLLFGASTLARWVRTVRGSSDRAVLREGLVRGLKVGLVNSPRPNGAIIADAGPTASLPGLQAPEGEPQPFTLLISTWAGDDPGFLRLAFSSSVTEQTRPPSEVVLVQDGPVPDELADELEHLVTTSPVPVKRLVMAENVGLGPALDRGLATCTYEIVARMDSDDVSHPERFARQLPLVEAGADIVGSGLLEFGAHPDDVVGQRTPPTDPDEIRRVIRFRDPFNHPTVVYRRNAVLRAGGYTDMPLMEDYLLFTRMLAAGARPANLAEPLVRYRVGEGAYARRGGTRLLRSELALQRRFLDLGLTTRRQYLRNVAIRGAYRLVPERVRKLAYRALLANRGDRPRG